MPPLDSENTVEMGFELIRINTNYNLKMEGREYEKEVPQKRKKVQKIASLNDAEEQRIENQVADSCAAKAKKSKKTKKSEEVSDWVRVTTNT